MRKNSLRPSPLFQVKLAALRSGALAPFAELFAHPACRGFELSHKMERGLLYDQRVQCFFALRRGEGVFPLLQKVFHSFTKKNLSFFPIDKYLPYLPFRKVMAGVDVREHLRDTRCKVWVGSRLDTKLSRLLCAEGFILPPWSFPHVLLGFEGTVREDFALKKVYPTLRPQDHTRLGPLGKAAQRINLCIKKNSAGFRVDYHLQGIHPFVFAPTTEGYNYYF